MKITKFRLLKAWEKYRAEFDREAIEVGGGFGKFESEMLYSAIRLLNPKFIIEMSPDKGWTTSIMIMACEKNEKGCEIYSFDMKDYSQQLNIKQGKVVRNLIVGDAHKTLTIDFYIENCDFMFIDADHSYDFGKWYSKDILPKLKVDTPIWIHDWATYESNGSPHNECSEFWEGKWPISHGEPGAVKENFIKNGLGIPIMNCTDVLKEQDKDYYDPKSKQGRSPSQILIRSKKL